MVHIGSAFNSYREVKMKIDKLLQRVQPQMDSLNLDDIPPNLQGGIQWARKMTGISTPDYAKRLLVLNAKGAITDDEYVGLVFHFSEHLHMNGSATNDDAQSRTAA